MKAGRWKLAAVGLLLPWILAACSTSTSERSTSGSDRSMGSASGFSAGTSSAPVSDVVAEAQKLSTTPGCVALAEIICQLDSSNRLEDLVQKNDAQALFEILRETASQKSQTLESIDVQYDLKDILASEGIYVSISSNAVTNQPPASSQPSYSIWVSKFQAAASSKAASKP